MTDAAPAGRGWSLRRRLTAAFLVIGLLVVAGTALAAAALVSVNDAQHRQVDRLDPAIQASNDLFTALLNQETGLRGYALTRDPSFLQPYAQGQTDVNRNQERLNARVAGSPRLEQLARELETRAHDWQDRYGIRALRTSYETPVGQVPNVPFSTGKQLFDRIRDSYTALNRQLAADRSSARADLRTSSTWLLVLVIAAVVTVLSAMGLMALFLRRWVTRPLQQLGDEVRAVAGGDLEHEVRVAGPPDIVAVAGDADLMRRQIVSEYYTAVEARREAQAAEEQTLLSAAELRRSNAELEQFAYIASHDLQEPLRKVASFCQMLERRYAGQLDERADRYIAFAVDGAKRMQNLINDLLAFSRVGRTTAGFQPVDLNVCVAQAISDLEERLTETGAEVEVGELTQVPGDTSLLRQLFLNLIGNAVKFRSEAAPRVRITGEPDAEHPDELFAVTVTDNGIGIDPRYAEKVFAIFSRLHAREEYEGTGIGLALCRKIVEFHGGTIEVVQPPTAGDADHAGQTAAQPVIGLGGATLRFTLPLHGSGPAALTAAADDVPHPEPQQSGEA